jgi:predicted nucleotidyltransferase
MTNIPRDWTEFLSALRSESVRFLLIGGHALAFHVEARLTEDLDLFVEATPENAARLERALERFGFGGLVTAAELTQPDKVFMLGRKPWRIDLLTGVDGVTFEEAWDSRMATSFHGIPIDVIGRDALIKNKRAAGRRKDLMDVALLEERDDQP